MKVERVKGEKKGKIMLYALSTCVWCKKTKDFLTKLGVEFDYVFVDLLKSEEKDKMRKEVEKWNPRCSYPTLVVNDKVVIVGFKTDEIKEAIGYGL